MTVQKMSAHIKTMTMFLISNASYIYRKPESHHPCCDLRLQKIDDVDCNASLITFLKHLMLFK